MDEIYNQLKKNNLLNISDIIIYCQETDFEKLLNLILKLFLETNSVNTKIIKPSLYNFSSSINLSGGDFPCELPLHRLDRVNNLGRFSSFFADSITIHNPLDFIYAFIDPNNNNDYLTELEEFKFRNNAIVGLGTLIVLEPLIHANIVNISKTIYSICKDCDLLKEKATNELMDIFTEDDEFIFKLFTEKNIKIKVLKNDTIQLLNSESIIGEELTISFNNPKSYFKNEKGTIINKPTKKLINNISNMILSNSIDSIMFQKIESLTEISETYLTNSYVERQLLKKLGEKSKKQNFEIVNDNIPLLSNISFENILKLRKKYNDSFEEFRVEIENFMSNSNRFETQEEFSEWINSKLNNKINEFKKVQVDAKKNLIKDGVKSGFFLGASIAISTQYNYDIPSIFSLIQSMSSCGSTIAKTSDVQKKLEKNPSFFYFKLNEASI